MRHHKAEAKSQSERPSAETRIEKSEVSKRHLLLFCILYSAFCILFSIPSFADEPQTTITADTMDYDKNTSMYHAAGAVKVVQGKTKIEAEKMRYNETTGDTFAEGNVRYEDEDIIMNAETAEYNLNTKTGKFYISQVFSKGSIFNVSGDVIEKRGEKEYSVTTATVTSCKASPPEWCFKGKTMEIIIGDRFKGKNVTFNVNKLPVLYTPYLWGPALTERKTGLLTPVFGYSREKGFLYSQPFFWAISEDKDATVVLEWYGKRGLGKGLEYRYISPANAEGRNWIYNISDKKLDRNFIELHSSNSIRGKGFSAYLNLNLLSGRNFYREYSRHNYERIQRFLESTGEISSSSDMSRLYLMYQYLVDLKDGQHTSDTPQRLPELGYVMNPRSVGPVLFSLTSSASNFWRDRGVFGQRLDIHPKISHYFGDKVIFSQNLGLRNTTYYMHRNETSGFKNIINREIFDYNVTASSRLIRRYLSYNHVIEPSLSYTYIPRLKRDKTNLPSFDSAELYSTTSVMSFSLMNRVFDKDGEFLTFSLSESYNSLGGDRAFSPITLAASVGRPDLQLRGDTSYNTYNGKMESLNSDIQVGLLKDIAFSLGERYNKVNKTMFFDLGLSYIYSKTLSAESRLWYDAKGGGVRDFTFKTRYQKQCWGVSMSFYMKPGDDATKTKSDYTIHVTFDLLGLGSMKI